MLPPATFNYQFCARHRACAAV